MRKFWNIVALCGALAALLWCGTLIADRQRLNEGVIRLHVVAESDSEEDQRLKLKVKDAIVESMEGEMLRITDVDGAEAYLQSNLSAVQMIAEEVLRENGTAAQVTVKLCREKFDAREYDTFTLPAGVYKALRVTIGEGEGKNWWCVVFPTLCMSGTSEGFEDVAAGAGFPDPLTGALTGEEEYKLRFFLLDALGRLENILYPE